MQIPKITEPLLSFIEDGFYSVVWDKGFTRITEEGVWYKMYINHGVKKTYPTAKAIQEALSKLDYIYLDNYEEHNQIIFIHKTDEDIDILKIYAITEILC